MHAQETLAAGAPEELRLDAVPLRADADSVAAFRRAIALGADADPGADAVPATYPFRWLTLPELRPALTRMMGAGVLPVHEGQSFAYERPLASGADYVANFVFTRTHGPERLTVAAAISDLSGAPCASFEAVLRLVPVEGRP
ncbi:hypothetical protein [Methylocella sp.]|uniref:hypothetical protein n=1 Tax=Methylocella sp. TaxID=1978226 RepID=UPI0037846438